MSVDYRSTVFLPKTDFPMRGGLAQREPETLARWNEMDLFARLREASEGREKFILHDGPPYANGHLHIGHALNKILKDLINRAHQMLGKDAHYVPGWDCHGLPIEWKIEEQYRAAGKDKDAVPVLEFRKECREFAEKWVTIQTEEFKRLGVVGNWERPYTTMSFDAEAQIVREIGKFLMNGGIYKGSRPVLWSVVEKTALADAEVEYHDHTSTTIWVRFPVLKAADPLLEGASVVIWTTTPWTIPGNRAIGFGEEIDYAVFQVDAVAEGSAALVGEKLVLARELAEQVKADAKIEAWTELGKVGALAGTLCGHPWHGFAAAEGGYDFDVPLLAGDFVTTEQGTGFVHIAPGHGADDWALGLKNGIEIPQTVDGAGYFYDHVPLLAGAVVYDADGKPGDANGKVIKYLAEAGRLLTKGKEEPGGREILSYCCRNDRDALQTLLALVRSGGRGTSLKVRMNGRGGDSAELLVSASLFQQEQANSILLRLSRADEEQAENQDAANARQLPQIIEQMPDGFVVTDADLRVIAANTAFIELIQAASPEQVRDAPLEQWIGRNETDASILLKNLKEIGSIKSYATMVRGAYGMTEPVEISAVSVPGEDMNMIGFSIRSTFGRASAQQVIANHALPSSIEQLTDLVGQVSLKELVREATDVVERLCIEAALQLTKNNRASAAEMLGLSRQRLYSKMHRYNLGNLQNPDN